MRISDAEHPLIKTACATAVTVAAENSTPTSTVTVTTGHQCVDKFTSGAEEDDAGHNITCQDVCNDTVASRFLCPHTCGHCNQEEPGNFSEGYANCQDKLPRKSCLQHCDSALAKQLCPIACDPTDHFKCEDHSPCAKIPNACQNSTVAIHVCPRFCKMCDILRELKTIERCIHGHCADIGSEESCNVQSSMCNDPLAPYLCKRTCNFCEPTLSSSSTEITTSNHFKCEDHSTIPCAEIPNACQDSTVAIHICPRFCEMCGEPTLSSSSTEITTSSTKTNTPISPSVNTTINPSTLSVTETSGSVSSLVNTTIASATSPVSLVTTTSSTVSTTTSTNTTQNFGSTGPSVGSTNAPLTTPGQLSTTRGEPTLSSSSTEITTSSTKTNTPISPSVNTTINPSTLSVTKTSGSVSSLVNTNTASATSPVSTRAPVKVSICYTCGELDSEIPCTRLEMIPRNPVQCSDDKPYCMNDIIQYAGMEPAYYKRCVDQATCSQEWYYESSDKPQCYEYDPNVYTDELVCHFCCHGDLCNGDLLPAQETLYTPN